MLSLRARLFVVISLFVLLILAVSIFLVLRSKNKTTDTETILPDGSSANIIDSSNFNYTPNIITPLAGGEVQSGTPVKPVTTLEAEQNAVRQYAKIFIERFNSYSSENNFQNIIEVRELVTADLWKTISARMNQAPSGSFVGVTTKVFTTELVKWSSSEAVVNMSASIREEKNGVFTDRQQSVVVDLIKENGNWLISKFKWE